MGAAAVHALTRKSVGRPRRWTAPTVRKRRDYSARTAGGGSCSVLPDAPAPSPVAERLARPTPNSLRWINSPHPPES
jgi:hypothetical protein